MKAKSKSGKNGKILKGIIPVLMILMSIGSATAQLINPLKGGERILWVGNSFSAFFGPVGAAIDSVYSVADPTFKLPYIPWVGKGCGIFKEYVIWGSVPGGTGVIDSINHGHWNYCVFQSWEDADNWDQVADTFMGCGGSPTAFPNNEDTLLKYLDVLDSTAKSVGARTMLYAPHVGIPEWIGIDSAQFAQTFAFVVPKLHNMFYAPEFKAWDSVRHLLKTTNYSSCYPAQDNGFIPLFYSDCGHQNGTSMALDAFTWYTILSGGLSGVGLVPNFPSPMEHPGMRDTLAGVGCVIGRRILQLNGFGNDFEAPTIPDSLVSSNITSTSFTLSWAQSTDNVGVTGYEVYQNGISIGTTPTDSMSIISLGPGTPYSMTVRAFDAAGHYTPYSKPYFVVTTGIPLIANGSFETPVVSGNVNNPAGSSWNFSGNTGITSTPWTKNGAYDGKQTAFLNVGSNDTISQMVTLEPATYQCSLFAGGPAWQNTTQPLEMTIDNQTFDIPYNQDQYTNGQWQKVSATFTIKTQGSYELKFWINLPDNSQTYNNIDKVVLEILNDTIPPSQPSKLVSSNILSSDFTLSWTASTDIAGIAYYKVFQDGDSIGTSEGLSFSISGLIPATTYSYFVEAEDLFGNISIPSNTLKVTTTALDTIPPSVPTGLTYSALTDVSFTLSWNKSSDSVGINEYIVYKDSLTYGTTTSQDTSMPIPFLNPSTTYSMNVKAKDAAGNFSALSIPLLVTTLTLDEISENRNNNEIVSISPNPAKDKITIFNLDESFKYRVEILDISGKILLNQLVQKNNSVDVSILEPGIYIVKVSNSSVVFISKLIKE